MGRSLQFRHSGECRYVGPRNPGATRAGLSNTTCHINSLLRSLDPGLRRDDVVAGNRALADGHWPVYSVFRIDAGKDVRISLNVVVINQKLID